MSNLWHTLLLEYKLSHISLDYKMPVAIGGGLLNNLMFVYNNKGATSYIQISTLDFLQQLSLVKPIHSFRPQGGK